MTYLNALVSGVVVGGGYSLLAVGLALIFSTSGVLNFAHAGFAMWAAYLYSWFGTEHGWNAWVAALVTVSLVTLMGIVAERLVIRRVADASPLVRLMTTLGLLALMQGLVLQVFGFEPRRAKPLFESGSITLGSLGVTYQQIAVFMAAVGLAAGLAAFLRLTRTGLAVRAVAQDTTASRLVGIRRRHVSRFNWAVAAAMAALAGVLTAPLTFVSIATYPLLLLKALAAALFGGLIGITGAFFGGFAIGGVESIAATASSAPGARELAVLIVVVLLLVLRRRWPEDVTVSWAPSGRRGFALHAPARLLLVSLVAFALVSAFRADFWGYVGALGLVYVLASLSIVVLTGWTGQISLMHGALVGVGAFSLTWYLNRVGLPFVPAALAAVGTGGVVALLISPMGNRFRGLQLAVATLAVSAAFSEWLFQFRGTSWLIERPSFFYSDRSIFIALLGLTALAFLVVHRLRSSAWGRMMLAVRQSPEAAAHFAISARRVRLLAYGVSGVIAALGGVFFAVLLTAVKPGDFGALLSMSFLLYAVVGGSESLSGPVIAALIFAFGPQLFRVSQTSASALPDILSGLLVILLIVARPGGLATLLDVPARPSRVQPEPEIAPPVLARREGAPRRLTRRNAAPSPALGGPR